MSAQRTDYIVFGYDFSKVRDEILIGNELSEETKKFFQDFKIGNIKFFDDPMNGNHLFFGFIESIICEDEDLETISFSVGDIERQRAYVNNSLMRCELTIPEGKFPYKVISFSEWC